MFPKIRRLESSFYLYYNAVKRKWLKSCLARSILDAMGEKFWVRALQMYYRLQKFANTFLCESSRQVGSASRRPLGDADAGG